MTITLSAHRALTTKLAGRSFNVVTRMGYNPWIARVNPAQTDKSANPHLPESALSRTYAIATRTYATTTAKKSPATKRTTAAKGAKSRTTKKKPAARKAKPAAKKKATPRKKKVAPKTKKATKPKVTKTSIAAKTRAELNELKQKALMGQEPSHSLPESAWQIVFGESHAKGSKVGAETGQQSREAAAKYRSLSPEERERYNHLAVTNKQQNQETYRKWVTSFTPLQIVEANAARRALNRRREEIKTARNLKTYSWRKLPLIKDDRRPKTPVSAYLRFNGERQKSGDFAGMNIPERARLISREWKALSAAEGKPYEDAHKADQMRYVEEVRTVLGIKTQTKPKQ